MNKITINHKDVGETEYIVYTRQEADEAGIEYKFWKEADEGGYALSDDGYVAKVIKKKEYRDGKSVYLRFPFGYVLWKPRYGTTKLRVEGRQDKHTFTGKKCIDVKMGQDKLQNLALCFAHVFDRDLAIHMAIGDVSPGTRHKYRRIMKTERFSKLVNEKVQELLQQNELTEQYTLALLKEVIGMAKEKNDITNLMRAIENLQDMHGMRGGKVKKTLAVEESKRRELIDSIETEKRRIEAEQSE